MLKPNKSRNAYQQRIIGDLTSSQLVLAICIFLIAALVCFSLGVVVGKYEERSNRRDGQAGVSAHAPQRAEQTPPNQGMQTTPRTIAAKNMPGYPESPGSAPGAVSSRPRVSELPAPPRDPAPQEPPPPETAHPPQEAATPAPAEPAQEKKEPQQTPEPEQKQPPAPAAVADSPMLEPLETPNEKTGSPAPAPAPAADNKGIYTIQVAALSAANRQEQALQLKNELQGRGLKPDILTADEGARLCVVVGRYQNRQEAQAACNELRKIPRFADSFVRTR